MAANIHKLSSKNLKRGAFLLSLLMMALMLQSVSGIETMAANKPSTQHQKVVEANHFYSDSDTTATYNIANVQTERSLILVIRNKTSNAKSQDISRNNIEITLSTNGKEQSKCKFDSYSDLCVIEKVESDLKNMTLGIKCDKLPCDLSWTIFQPIPKPASNTTQQPLQELYIMSESSQHMIGIVSCNDPELVKQGFSNGVRMFSNNDFETTVNKDVIYYLFNNEKKGYMFSEVEEKFKACVKLSVYNVNSVIKMDSSNKDFVMKDSESVFKLEQLPAHDIMIDASIHSLDKKNPLKSSLIYKITAENSDSSQRETIQEQKIRTFGNKTTFDFKHIAKAISAKKYKNVQLEFLSSGEIIMLNFVISSEERHEIEMGEISYFDLKKDDKVLYKLAPNRDAEQDKQTYIFVSNKNKITRNKESCKIKDGCEFQITATDDIEGTLYLGEGDSSSSDKSSEQQIQQEVVFTEMKTKVTKKGKEGDIHLYKTPISASSDQESNAFQMVVNSPNVIMYLAAPSHCKGQAPSKDCYEKVMNYHHPTIYEPIQSKDSSDDWLYISVEVLDNCEYTITRINSDDQVIELKEGESFSYLMDDAENQVGFRFKASSKKQPVHFNLISPLNSLYLLVENGNKMPNADDMNIASTDGYISFSKSEVKSEEFRILVTKMDDHRHKFVHFTLIVSTNQTNLRLEPGIAHYETLEPEHSRDFAFEFSPQEEYIVSFYTHNSKAKSDKVNLQMMVSDKDEWKNIPEEHSFIIDRQSDVLQLKDVAESLCEDDEGQSSCQIFIRLTNTMDSEVDVTLNLMVKGSIIELKDGIWQSYAENAIASSSHFYFYPKHKDKSVEIMYKSVFTDLRISYTLWKADDKNINPTEWPFPSEKRLEHSKEKDVTLYKPTKHISIDKSALSQCWPSCVILVSLFNNSTQVKGEYTPFPDGEFLPNGEFSIMASNSYIEIPEKTKMDVVLKQNETKYFMIDLKYALEKDSSALTIFTYNTIGFYELKGNVYSQMNPRCPGEEDEGDFKFGNLETQIKVSTINEKLSQNDMEDDRNLYICLLAKAYSHSKMAIEYTSDENIIKVLDMDSFETASLSGDGGDDQRIYQVSANQEYYIKFTRNQGFPFVDVAKCEEGGDYEKCFEDFKNAKEAGKQLISKTESFTEEPCSKCIIFIKVSCQEPTEVDIHLQSKYTEIELKEGKIISDFTNENEENRYLITSLRSEETILNIQVTEGDVEIHVTDFGKVDVTKKSTSVAKSSSKQPEANSRMVHIVIPAQKQSSKNQKGLSGANTQEQLDQLLGLQWMSAFGMSDTFSYLHMTIKSASGKGATAYTVTYSSGERETYLQDGLITDYMLEPSKETTFYYENPSSESHAYLYLSMPNSAELYNLDLKIFYLVDPQDEDSAVEISAEKPPMRKKTPNPTILFSLPPQRLFIFKMKTPSSTEQKLSIGINHQEVMLLPFDHEFPFSLHKQQNLNFLVDVNNPGYLKISLRKCDESNPSFSYTFDYDGFQNQEFTYTSVLNDDPHFEYYIKAKEVGTLYINFVAEDEDDSLMSIKVEYSAEKIKSNSYKAGNKGMIEYQLLDSTSAELTLTEVVCSGSSKQCASADKEAFDYYTISALKEQDLYTQTVCPAQYFAMASENTVSITPLPLTKIKQNSDSNGNIIFKYTLMDHVSYVGVKAINKRTSEEIYYRPIEIVTMWGQISRTSTSHKLTIIAISLVFLLCLLVWWRRQSRKGYIPLEEDI